MKAAFGAIGSAGLKPCLLCRNVVAAWAGIEDEYFVSVGAARARDLDLHDRASITKPLAQIPPTTPDGPACQDVYIHTWLRARTKMHNRTSIMHNHAPKNGKALASSAP
eukprot:4610369-Pyramimonas_sp.AAC.1